MIHVRSQTVIRQKCIDILDLTGAVMRCVTISPLNVRTETAATVDVTDTQWLEVTLDEDIWMTPGTWRLQFKGTFEGIPLILDEDTVEVAQTL